MVKLYLTHATKLENKSIPTQVVVSLKPQFAGEDFKDTNWNKNVIIYHINVKFGT